MNSCPHSRYGTPARCSQCAGAAAVRVAAWRPVAEAPSADAPLSLADKMERRRKTAAHKPAAPRLPPIPDGWITLKQLARRCGVSIHGGLDRHRRAGRLVDGGTFTGKTIAYAPDVAESFHKWFTSQRKA